MSIQGSGQMINDPQVFLLHNYGVTGLSENPNGVHTGTNSGYQAINIAVLAGARRILLLGYDMHFPNGKSHWHGEHPIKIPEQHYTGYTKQFATMLDQLKKLGVEVVNCSPGSALKYFRMSTIEQELPT